MLDAYLYWHPIDAAHIGRCEPNLTEWLDDAESDEYGHYCDHLPTVCHIEPTETLCASPSPA